MRGTAGGHPAPPPPLRPGAQVSGGGWGPCSCTPVAVPLAFDSVVIKAHQERAESDTAARAAGLGDYTSGIRRVASTPASAADLGAAFSRRAGAAPLRDWQSRCAADGLARAGGTSRRRPSSVTSCGRLACGRGRRGAVRDARGGDPKGGRGRGTIDHRGEVSLFECDTTTVPQVPVRGRARPTRAR